MILAVVQQQQIDVPETSWLGSTTMAGVGITLTAVSVLCIKGRAKKGGGDKRQQMGPWGPLFGVLMNKLVGNPTARAMDKLTGGDDSEGLDWRSLMTFFIGMFAMTAILSSRPGPLLSLIGWAQGLIASLATSVPFISEVGTGGICLFLLILAWRQRNDDAKDLFYGSLCGFFFPLGGGKFAELTFTIGHWIPHVLNMN